MKTAGDVKRARVLLHAVEAAKEWRDTFQDPAHQGADYEQVEFGEIGMTQSLLDTGGNRSTKGFDGRIALLREDAIAMMNWLECFARAELENMGVNV